MAIMGLSKRLAWGLATLCAVIVTFAAVDALARHPRAVKVPRLIGMTLNRAERVLTQLRLRSPARAFVRYAPAAGSSRAGVLQLSAGTDGDRPVTAQSIPAGVSVPTGSVVELGTTHAPRGPPRRANAIFPRAFGRYEIGGDDGTLTLEIPSVEQCATIDHLDLTHARSWIVATPFLLTNRVTPPGCDQGGPLSLRLALDRPLAGRAVLRFPPSAPRAGLFKITTGSWGEASDLPSSRALALYFAHSSNCGLLGGATVKETVREIRITLTVGNLGSNGICLADLRQDAAVVKLAAPVGQRMVVDDFHAALGGVIGRLQLGSSTIVCCLSPVHEMPRRVQLLDASGNTAAVQVVKPERRFRLTAPVGRYTLTATGCFPQPVTVTRKRSARVTVMCPIA